MEKTTKPLALASDTPEIGSPEAAVRACVSLIAGLCGQPERMVAYWLDLYFQVRSVYERDRGGQADPHYLTREDLWPVFREMWTDAMKGAAHREAEKRQKEKALLKEQGAQEEDSGPPAVRTDEPAPELTTNQKRTRHNTGNSWGKDAAAEKRRVRDRLLAMREQGLSTAQIVKASKGRVMDGHLWEIIQGHVVTINVYRALDEVLNEIEAAGSGGEENRAD